METPLYPFKFLPLFKNKVWGGNKIKSLGFNYDPLPNCGELWALSSLPGNESVIANGFLAENTINEALEIYMSEILGEKNFDHFGTDFPLLFKIIDANDDLSIQVHPDDHLAQQRGMPFGKTEMWYVIESDPGATIVDGFSRQTTPEQYQQHLQQGNLEQLLHLENTQAGDTFFIPAGRVHAIGKGNLFAEIQQSSDCTYRIYDYNRPDTNGQLRQLQNGNSTTQLAQCPYFTTNLIALDKPLRKNFSSLDSFVVYLCVDGIAAVKSLETIVPLHMGECALVPAVADTVELFSEGPAKLLEVYIDPALWVDNGQSHSHDYDWLAQFVGSPANFVD